MGDAVGDGGLCGLVGEEKEGSEVEAGGEVEGGGDGLLGGGGAVSVMAEGAVAGSRGMGSVIEVEAEEGGSEAGGASSIAAGPAVGEAAGGGEEEGGRGGGEEGFMVVSRAMSDVGGKGRVGGGCVGASVVSGEEDACVASEAVGWGSLIPAADGEGGERQRRRPSRETAATPPSDRPSQTAPHAAENRNEHHAKRMRRDEQPCRWR